MIKTTRRAFVLGAGALVAACDNSVDSAGAATIDTRVDATMTYMHDKFPETKQLTEQASGILVMPLVGEAGFVVGGSYGEGALLIGGATVDYYSATQATVGLQAGAQQFAYTLFFMTPDALKEFRTSPGWNAGAAAEFVGGDTSANLTANTATKNAVIAFLFAQQGLLIGATIDGTKYSRIVR